MDAVFLARLQFALTIAFHYIFPTINIGLGLILVLMEGMYLKTRNPLYLRMTQFWVKVFGLCFAIGVATGIVMEFQFGTNWAHYSRYVGDVFGSALAAEGIFAFFLESGFLALLLFGWNKVSPRMHFFSTLMVCSGAHFSAIWIIVANSWQQTPDGFKLQQINGMTRAVTDDFWAVVFNPSMLPRLTHAVLGCWQAGACLVFSVSAYYLLRKRHVEFARASIRIAMIVGIAASLLQLATGHYHAMVVAEHQPAKLAAFEGHFAENAAAPLYLWGWVDEDQQEVRFGMALPGMLSLLVHGDASKPVVGLNAFAEEDRPPVNIVFQAYHLMVAVGMALIALNCINVVLLLLGRLWETRIWLWALVFSVLLPQIASQTGWIAAEVGRQPWAVYGLLRTADSVSETVMAGEILTSMIMFGVVYALLFVMFIYLLNEKIQHGPNEAESDTGGHRA
ncbi:cytochrome ubiquinol oxidase subunit I [Candidatus Sumerlaeota bacterium]|nr:cytochrome ubiquinol oxidase subunit I [Candidatus Sumerlaeota bacterium]